MPICMQHAHYLLHQQAEFSDGSIILSGGNSRVQDKGSKMKTKTKCNEKLIGRVEAMTDEDERFMIRGIAEALDILSESVTSIPKYKLRYSKISAEWIPHILTKESMRERVAHSKISSKYMTTVIEVVPMKSLLVMKHGCTVINLREKHRTERECQKEETRLKSQKEFNLRRRYCTQYSWIQAESCYNNHAKRARAVLWNNTETMCLLRSTWGRPNTGRRNIKFLHYRAPTHKRQLM